MEKDGGVSYGFVLLVFHPVQHCAGRDLVHLRHPGFSGQGPLIKLPFNQYVRDPEYRAFWQKKNGVFYMLNALAFLILAFTPVTSLVYRILFGVAIGGDLLYLVAYESWNHSAD